MKVFDINPMGGGRIIRDQLWFYLTYREVICREHGPRHVLQQERRRPDQMARRLRHSRPAFSDSVDPERIGRFTWQASPRNKISLSHSEQFDSQNKNGGGIRHADARSAGPDALHAGPHPAALTGRRRSPIALLLEAGWGNYLSRYANTAPRLDGLHTDALISVLEQCSAGCPNNGGIAGLIYRCNQPLAAGSSAIRSARWPRCGRRSRTSPARTA